MSQIFGDITVTINGTEYATQKQSSKVDLGGVMREKADGHPGSYTVTSKPFRADLKVLIGPGQNLAALQTDNATVVAKADTGQTYIARNAYTVEPPVLNAGNPGTVDVSFEGPPAEEV